MGQNPMAGLETYKSPHGISVLIMYFPNLSHVYQLHIFAIYIWHFYCDLLIISVNKLIWKF